MCKTAAFVIVKGMRNGIVFHGAARGQASASNRRDAAKTRMTDSISPRRTAVFVRSGASLVGSEPRAKGKRPRTAFSGSLASAAGTVAENRSDGRVPCTRPARTGERKDSGATLCESTDRQQPRGYAPRTASNPTQAPRKARSAKQSHKAHGRQQ